MTEVALKRRFTFFFTAFGVLIACTGQISVRYDIRSWNDARDTCRKQTSPGSCDLVTKARLHEQWTTLQVAGNDSVWVGGRRFSRWVWHGDNGKRFPLFQDNGCRQLSVPEPALKTPQTNGPQHCYSVCNNAHFVYLQGDNCYCSSTLEGEPARDAHCNLSCKGSDDTCGGKRDYFSVYSIPRVIRFEDAAQLENCAVGRLQENVVYVESASCGGYHHYFCLSDTLTTKVPTRSDQYHTAVDRCRTRHNSSLISLTPSSPQGAGQLLSDLRALSVKVTGSAPFSFWLPLQREVKAVWVDEGGQFGSCLAATPRTAGYRLTDLPCSTSLAFICDCGGTITDRETNGSGDKNGSNSYAMKSTQLHDALRSWLTTTTTTATTTTAANKKSGSNAAIVAVIVVAALLLNACLIIAIIFLLRYFTGRRAGRRETERLQRER